MADRFPSLDEIDQGMFACQFSLPYHTHSYVGQTDVKGDGDFDALGDSEPSDFLARERAALGDDASLFSTAGDNTATIADGDDDLLGGGGASAPAAAPSAGDMGDFESSFPSIDTQTEVCPPPGTAPSPAF